MATYNELQGVMDRVLNSYGQPVLLRFYSASGAVSGIYNDQTSLTQSGNDLWAQGYIQNLTSSNRSSEDHILVEQGRILYNDSKLYMNGSIYRNGSLAMKIGIGSPTTITWFTTLPSDDQPNPINGVDVYRKLYIRVLPNGSLFGE